MINALLLTVIIETVLLIILKYKDYKIYIISVVINIITNLSLNYYLTNIIFKNFLIYSLIVVGLEIIVLFIETLAYMLYFKEFKESFKIAFILNISSFTIGLLLVLMGVNI